MKKFVYVLVIGLVVTIVGCNQVDNQVTTDGVPADYERIYETSEPEEVPEDGAVPDLANIAEEPGVDMLAQWAAPLDRIGEREIKKSFGIYVEPASSPVQPERFQGYHTGVDFEVLPDEGDVMVKAVCAGRVLVKQFVSGYGGVVVTSCLLDGKSITVLYGHLDLDSVGLSEWDEVGVGQDVGLLGDGFTEETDGERSHLHLAFHKGEAVKYAGYVGNEADLANWIDPCDYVCE